jgi:hypothetical protein
MLEPFDAEFVLPDLCSQPEGSAPNSPPGPFLPPIGLGSIPAGGSTYPQAPPTVTVAPPPDCAPPNPEPAKRGRGRPLGSTDTVPRKKPANGGGRKGRKDKKQRVRRWQKAPPKS